MGTTDLLECGAGCYIDARDGRHLFCSRNSLSYNASDPIIDWLKASLSLTEDIMSPPKLFHPFSVLLAVIKRYSDKRSATHIRLLAAAAIVFSLFLAAPAIRVRAS